MSQVGDLGWAQGAATGHEEEAQAAATGHEEAQATMAVPLSFPAHGGMNPLVFLGPISGIVLGIPLSFWVQRWAPYRQSACSSGSGSRSWSSSSGIAVVVVGLVVTV